MSGGIVQLASSGYYDGHLIRNPEITFFKERYDRYHRFGIDQKELEFDTDVEFDQEVSINIPEYGPLVSKCYLKVELPQVSLSDSIITNTEYITAKNLKITNQTNKVASFKTKYDNLKTYADLMIKVHRIVNPLLKPSKINVSKIKNSVLSFKSANNSSYNTVVKTIEKRILDKTNVISKINSVEDVGNDTTRTTLLTVMSTYHTDLQNYLKSYFFRYQDEITTLNDIKSDKIEFAWNSNLGNFIATDYELQVDGKTIDKYTDNTLHIESNLRLNDKMKQKHDEIIGNISSMITFDKKAKPNYTLYIPLQFDMCQTPVNALPLVALSNSDVDIKFKFNNIKNCCYLEDWGYEFDKISKRVINREDFSITSYTADHVVRKNKKYYFKYIVYDKKRNNVVYQDPYVYKDDLKALFPDLTSDNQTYIVETYGSIKTNETDYSLDKTEWIAFRKVYLNDTNLTDKLKDIHYYVDKEVLLNSIKITTAKLLVDYVQISDDDKKKYVSKTLHYMITKTQENEFTVKNGNVSKYSFSFNKPVKYLNWVQVPIENTNISSGYYEKTPTDYKNFVTKAQLKLENGNFYDRERESELFTRLNLTKHENVNNLSNIFNISFCLNPNESNPSGSCNFSEFRDKSLYMIFDKDTLAPFLDTGGVKVLIYCKSHSLIRIKHGKLKVLM